MLLDEIKQTVRDFSGEIEEIYKGNHIDIFISFPTRDDEYYFIKFWKQHSDLNLEYLEVENCLYLKYF